MIIKIELVSAKKVFVQEYTLDYSQQEHSSIITQPGIFIWLDHF